MNNKERETYLGVTAKLGYLKGGRWINRDWWKGQDQAEKNQIQKDFQRAKMQEAALMRQKLGLEPKKELK